MANSNGLGFAESRNTRSNAGFTARACASAYMVLVGVWVLLSLSFLYSALHGAKGTWPVVVVCACPLIYFLLWLGSFRITILESTLSYRTLFGGTLAVPLNEIEKAEIKVNAAGKGCPVWQLILWPMPTTQKKPIIINMKVFSKADLNRVFDVLGGKLETKCRFSLTSQEREDLLRKIP